MTKRFEFMVYKKVPGTVCTYVPTTVTKTGATLAEALAALTEEHPGHFMAEHLEGLWREVPT